LHHAGCDTIFIKKLAANIPAKEGGMPKTHMASIGLVLICEPKAHAPLAQKLSA
jgi:hypothetical protein